MVAQSSLPGCLPELRTEAKDLFAKVEACVGVDNAVPGDMDELCPACHVVVPLQNITSAMCTNGHAWGTSLPCYLSLPIDYLSDSTVLGNILYFIDAQGSDLCRL
jgi:hypothetical protein